MRVLLAAQPTTAGVAVCVRELARAGVQAGFDVTVACPGEGDLAGWASDAGARWVDLRLVRAPRPGDVRGVARVRDLASRSDVIHLHSSKAAAVGRLGVASLPRSRRPACVVSPHAWSWLVGGRAAPLYRVFERWAARWADVIVAVSEEERLEGEEVLGRRAPRGGVRVIPNGVDTARYCPAGPTAARSAQPLLVCVGRLSVQRGQDVAVRALAALRARDARLRLVGDGPERASLGRLATRLGVAERVELVGPVADVTPELRAADVVVVPSRWEGMSLVMLEAMGCGAAVVATRVQGASALGGVGRLVPPDDAGALATAVDALLASPEERQALGAAARRRVEERFTLERSVGQTLELWVELVAGAR